ncbi:MAG TPA: hypothetical protein VM122_08350 [Usitatibacter sp.]|nr:hypothetical protein [Usitatibacter sp.]
MKFPIRAGAFCAFVLCAVIAGPALAQTVTAVVVGRHIDYIQTSATDVQVNPAPPGPLYGGPYGFSVNVEGTNIGGIAAPMVTGPFNTAALGSFLNNGRLVFNTSEGIWRLGPNANDWGSPTLADLDSKFGNGTYTVTVAGTSVPLTLTGNAYPSPPLLALSGGYWSNGTYMLDSDKPLTITTTYAGYGSHVDDFIEVGAEGVGTNTRSAAQSPGGGTLSFTVPASTFIAGGTYIVGANFAAVVDKRNVAALPSSLNAAYYAVSSGAKVLVSPPVFPMVVTASITPTVANVTAAIKYRPQDVGTTGNVYVFALAPASMVHGSAPLEPYGYTRGSAKDTPLPCVLAQLSSSGQLTAASSSSLQSYLSGVLGSQGATVSVLNNVSTAVVQGAVFYVGYGASSAAMLNNGINRSAVTVPGPATCQPQPPEAGWWWNKSESGRGFSIETQGNRLFMAGYLYDASGRSTWVVSGGLTSLDGSFFHGDLQAYSGGQTLAGAYRPPVAPTTLGQVTVTFSDARNGTLVWPGGTIPIERFTIAPPTSAAKFAFVPENGWWWNPAESGRGYFMEFSNNSAFIAGYMYNDTGNPLWYVAGSPMPGATSFQGPWSQYANGQTLTGAYQAPIVANANVGALGIQFQSSTSATLTLPGGRQVPIVRFGF